MQLSGKEGASGIEALEKHPNVKRVTPHKMVTRSLKYVPVEDDKDDYIKNKNDAKDVDIEEPCEDGAPCPKTVHRRSLSLVSHP